MVVSNPGRVPFFMMGISHELTIQRFWGTPMTMESLKISGYHWIDFRRKCDQ